MVSCFESLTYILSVWKHFRKLLGSKKDEAKKLWLLNKEQCTSYALPSVTRVKHGRIGCVGYYKENSKCKQNFGGEITRNTSNWNNKTEKLRSTWTYIRIILSNFLSLHGVIAGCDASLSKDLAIATAQSKWVKVNCTLPGRHKVGLELRLYSFFTSSL